MDHPTITAALTAESAVMLERMARSRSRIDESIRTVEEHAEHSHSSSSDGEHEQHKRARKQKKKKKKSGVVVGNRHIVPFASDGTLRSLLMRVVEHIAKKLGCRVTGDTVLCSKGEISPFVCPYAHSTNECMRLRR